MLWAHCSGALNQQKTIASAGRAKRGKIESPVAVSLGQDAARGPDNLGIDDEAYRRIEAARDLS